MELLYIYNDKHNMRECEYNFFPNYGISFNPETETSFMEPHNKLPSK